MNYSKLSPFARALVMFAYKEEKIGKEVTTESFVKRFGERITERYMNEILSQSQPALVRNDGGYCVSKIAEITIRRFMNF